MPIVKVFSPNTVSITDKLRAMATVQGLIAGLNFILFLVLYREFLFMGYRFIKVLDPYSPRAMKIFIFTLVCVYVLLL